MSKRGSVLIVGGLNYAVSEVVHISVVGLLTKAIGHLEFLRLEGAYLSSEVKRESIGELASFLFGALPGLWGQPAALQQVLMS
jgi:hypothetical protein